MPVALDLSEEAILVLFGAFFDLLTLRRDVRLQLIGIPAVVWRCNLVFPVELDKVDEILAVCRSRIWHIVVRQPPLELSLMPFVIGWSTLVHRVNQVLQHG